MQADQSLHPPDVVTLKSQFYTTRLDTPIWKAHPEQYPEIYLVASNPRRSQRAKHQSL